MPFKKVEIKLSTKRIRKAMNIINEVKHCCTIQNGMRDLYLHGWLCENNALQ